MPSSANVEIYVQCVNCGTPFVIHVTEYKRKRSNACSNNPHCSSTFMCSRSCSTSYINKRTSPYKNDVERRINVLFNSLRKTTVKKRKKIPFALTLEQCVVQYYKQDGRCALTGLTMSLEKCNSMLQMSLDRIDSSGGYTPDNVQFVCLGVNRLKHTGSNQDVLMFLTLVKEESTL